MKRDATRKLVTRYFNQLSYGCDSPNCQNKFCASSGEIEKLTHAQGTAHVIQLSSQNTKLCDSNTQPSKKPRTDAASSRIVAETVHCEYCDEGVSSYTSIYPININGSSCSNSSSNLALLSLITYLDEERLCQLIEECKISQSYSKLMRIIGEVFSSAELLSKSFRRKQSKKIDEMLEKVPKDIKSLRTLEGAPDKDENSCDIKDETEPIPPSCTTVDTQSLRRSMEKLFQIFECPIYEALNNALHSLSILLGIGLKMCKPKEYIENAVHIFVMVYDIMAMAPCKFLENALPNISRAAARLPIWAEANLARVWAENCKSRLSSLLHTLQQLISFEVTTGSFNYVKDSEVITSTTKVLKILYYANILAGTMESSNHKKEGISVFPLSSSFSSSLSDNSFQLINHEKKLIEDTLETELGISAMDYHTPLIPFEEFYNEPLSNEMIYIRQDIQLYSFILKPATKVILYDYHDCRVRMNGRCGMILKILKQLFCITNPYLTIVVRRDHLIEDALLELEMIAIYTPEDFKKQLDIEFVGEQGIDEGGVSKEFFQLIIEEIFNPNFGMFITLEDTKTVWFNSTSLENDAQFTLIGIVLGLAFYNNIILAVNFPMVVYRKLMGGRGTFYDLADWNPVLFKSLKSMLDYTKSDMEEVFIQTFKINYTDVFGNTREHELKPNGADIIVNQDNKMEFIELYSDYLLNTSIESQFKAFKKGFEMVTDESLLKLLFRPEEIELLVCGSRKFDFIELEKSTEYEDGFTDKSQIIKDFWSIVHELSIELKRKLLEFTTGSDRVPVGGLSNLELIIARNGGDSDRLPTSYTCFNVLLLPEYENKEKLKDRLLKALNYSKGFGMR